MSFLQTHHAYTWIIKYLKKGVYCILVLHLQLFPLDFHFEILEEVFNIVYTYWQKRLKYFHYLNIYKGDFKTILYLLYYKL